MEKEKDQQKRCLRCSENKPRSEFILDGGDYYLHNICNKCRDLMTARTNFLIAKDKEFHKSHKVSYEITFAYRKMLINNEQHVDVLFK